MKYVIQKQLNFARQLHPSAVGQTLGPDLQGRYFTAVEIVERTDGKPGSTLLLEHEREVEG